MSPKQIIYEQGKEEQTDQNGPVKVHEHTFQRTEHFLILKVTMTEHNIEENEIQRRWN